jgi:hypothetical protein
MTEGDHLIGGLDWFIDGGHQESGSQHHDTKKT